MSTKYASKRLDTGRYLVEVNTLVAYEIERADDSNEWNLFQRDEKVYYGTDARYYWSRKLVESFDTKRAALEWIEENH